MNIVYMLKNLWLFETGICEPGYKGDNCDLCDTTYLWNGSGLAEIPADCELHWNKNDC